MVECLKGHARGQGPIADDRHDAAILRVSRGGYRHAKCSADRGTGVANSKGVVFAFAARRKGCEAAILLDRVQPLAPAGQHLMRVGLMAHVPDQAVVRRVEDVMQGDRQLDRAEPCGKVTAARADAMDQELAQFPGQY